MSFYFFLSALVFGFVFLMKSYSDKRDIYNILDDKEIFSLLDKAKEISFKIKYRDCLSQENIQRIYFQVEVPGKASLEQLKGIAQWVVKETLTHGDCHSITVDFDELGYIDFAPDGNWSKAGKVPVDNYKSYQFRYYLIPKFQ